MKTIQKLLLILITLFIGTNFRLSAQTNEFRHVPKGFSLIPIFTNNPVALSIITNLLAEPQPELSVPEVSHTWSPPGTFWTLNNAPVPLPYDPFPDLPVYAIGTNQYLIDDRSVDYTALDEQQQAENEALGLTNQTITVSSIDTNGLWIQVPTNSLATPHYFNVNVMNTVQGQPYDILTKADLLAPTWATELTVTGAVGNVTPVQLPMNGRTNLFVWARTSVAYSFYLVTEPLSQEVFDGDTVTFGVDTGGNTNLTFQWTFNGADISGATNNTYTIYNVLDGDVGYYACIISDGTNSLITTGAQLTTVGLSGDNQLMPIISSRQNYTFQNGMTYYIGSPIDLYGNTTIEAGAVIKFDFDNSTDSSLIIMGGLTCKTEPYNPAILTSLDDDSAGEWIYLSDGSPQTYITGVPYLDMTSATSNSISNLRFLYADWGVTTPVNTPRLDVWDCQFGLCDYGVVNLVAGNSTDSLHNVLFAVCEAGVVASSNSITIEGEQVTADVTDFCLSSSTPSRIALTNSILWGSALSASTIASVNVAMNPDNANFVVVGEGNYYLAGNSALHRAGTANISLRLQNELQNKTTYPPVAIADGTQISGSITLGPQAQRYTNGAPDLGYYYAALDYTVADFYLVGGNLTVLPGTSIGIRNDSAVDSSGSIFYGTTYGIYVSQGGSVTSHGTPNKPNIFVAADLVQETPNLPFADFRVTYSQYIGDWLPGIISFTSDFKPGETIVPSLDFRFSNFYLPAIDLHFCSGLTYDDFWIFSASSCVNLNLQDCNLHDGYVNIGQPDGYDYPPDSVYGSSTVTWNNTLFDNVSINLDPTFYEDGIDTNGLNVDLAFQAGNNLFRGGLWMHLEPVPASAGDWVFENNLFDQVNFIQDTSQPLDFDYNGYWPLTADSMAFQVYFDPWALANTNYLQTTSTPDGFTDGGNEQYLAVAPPYQCSIFGKYYLPDTTPLYGSGSTSAAGVGLYHYTTRTDQFKEGNEPSGHNVNIGLHYIAATNGVPIDMDGDGIPDYVEDGNGNGIVDANETDPHNPMSDGITPDASNSVYLSINLSGDGLVGSVKAALGINPLNSSNPLTLQQVPSSDSDIAVFELPVSYSVLTNIGGLNLNFNGVDVTLEDFCAATNGNTLLNWNTAYEPPELNYLQAQLTLSTSGDNTAILSGVGSIMPFYSTNVMQFFESDSMFDSSGAYLDAQLPEPDANYTIQLYDPSTTPPTFIKGITNSTSSGAIQENWDLTYDDGVTVFTGNTVNAVFNVDLLDPASGSSTKVLHRLGGNEQGNNFDFIYLYTPTNSALAYDFGNENGVVWDGMQNVVDTLCMPVTADGGHADHYDSYFDRYTSRDFPGQPGIPGYVTSRSQIVSSLFPDMTNGITKNFFCYSHGSGTELGNYSAPGASPSVYMTSFEVGNLLGNTFASKGGLNTQNPYRLVFLDGCSTASQKNWRRAFGIFPLDAPNQASRNKVGPQAYVGWATINTGWMNGGPDTTVAENLATAYTQTLDDFYDDWMRGIPLAQCIYNASAPAENVAPFPVPQNKKLTIYGYDMYFNNYSYSFTNVVTSPIYVVGHSGLTRGGINPGLDNYYPAPTSSE